MAGGRRRARHAPPTPGAGPGHARRRPRPRPPHPRPALAASAHSARGCDWSPARRPLAGRRRRPPGAPSPGRTAVVMTAAPRERSRTVLYLHGGGFTIGSTPTHRALATHVAAADGRHGPSPRLPPRARESLPRRPRRRPRRLAGAPRPTAPTPPRTALAGDSAGGWLALTAALRLREGRRLAARRPRPHLAVARSPGHRTARRPLRRHAPAGLAAALRRRLHPRRRSGRRRVRPAREGSQRPAADGRARRQRGDPAARRRPARGRAHGRPGVPVDLRRCDGLWHVAQASAGLVRGVDDRRGPLSAPRLARLGSGGRASAPGLRQRRRLLGPGRGRCPARPVFAAKTNSRRGSCSCPSETTSRRNSEASVQSATTRALRLNVGTRLTW